MDIEQKVTSLELSKQLKEAGARQESERFWFVSSKMLGVGKSPVNAPQVAAFDCAELLEGLPVMIVTDKGNRFLVMGRYPNHDYWIGYKYVDGDGSLPGPVFHNRDFVESLGKTKLWCLKEGHVKE